MNWKIYNLLMANNYKDKGQLMKKNILITISLALLLCVSMVVLIDKGNAEKSNNIIKIPPKIEGITLVEEEKAQSLTSEPLTILSANGKKHNYLVEVARTPEEQRIGMMFRKYIDENTGMLFLFEKASKRNFWMKNTLIPLDIVFIRKDGIINHIHPMAETESLKPISSNGEVIAVLEIAGGEAEILGINVGDRVLHKDFLPKK